MTKEIEIADSVFKITDAYKEGALADRRVGTRFAWNPYPENSDESCHWQYGHDNEADGEHIRDGVDLITDLPAQPTK
jgi:hypothetical protein